jgi:hypothetical protein
MMDVSKIQLSPTESELMQNAEVILTKNSVLQKMKMLLEEVQEQQLKLVGESSGKTEIFAIHPKISRGENYLGLPYFILDYPRFSTKSDFFFIRTMFWWGKFFSCTLHLSGASKTKFMGAIIESYTELKNYFIGVSDDPWAHHLEESDYIKIGLLTENQFAENCKRFDHIKIAAKHPLNEWRKAPVVLYENWEFFLAVCGLVP